MILLAGYFMLVAGNALRGPWGPLFLIKLEGLSCGNDVVHVQLSMRIAARVVAIPSCEPLTERGSATDSEGRT